MEEEAKKLQAAAGVCCCNCRQKLNPRQLFEDNVEDIAKSLAQIMLICGIHATKCRQARSIIKRAFVYYEKLRTQCSPSAAPGSRLNRSDVLQALRIKCQMERVEAMLSYSIVKRAFKAFFHGKPPASLSNPFGDAMAIHSQQRAWMHAAYKTSKIFEVYQPAFFWAHKFYEREIGAVYEALYSRMSARCNPMQVPLCTCRGCSKQVVPGDPKPPDRRVLRKLALKDDCDPPKDCILCGLQLPRRTAPLPRPVRNAEVNLPRCDKCNSPFLICECNIDQLTGEQYGECGQDSYKVKWYRLEDEQPQPKPKPKSQRPPCAGDMPPEDEDGDEDSSTAAASTEDWENHHCPVDCRHDSCSGSSDVCPGDVGSSNVCHGGASSEGSTSESCTDPGDSMVDKLEDYLNKLWAEEVAEKKNPQTYVARTIPEPREPCKRCRG
ncbi:uncharacterized protein LOC108154995 [Drosophila miranda]|uniref:uncharacterized protein LOC108154995 n=1 Tax=Drosophila miranda TaxID=7229 RepID=UPI0007E7416A|nr:uncharacterized protein LOC108154995 [Drosophila miranda]